MPEPREWIIQRCTQRWIGTELQYEDWPVYRPGAISCDRQDLMNHTQMMEALAFCAEYIPKDEFRGHNVMNCQCDAHTSLWEGR